MINLGTTVERHGGKTECGVRSAESIFKKCFFRLYLERFLKSVCFFSGSLVIFFLVSNAIKL